MDVGPCLMSAVWRVVWLVSQGWRPGVRLKMSCNAWDSPTQMFQVQCAETERGLPAFP